MNFSADIKPGQKVAIVGPTGAGKTTIVKLLMRFYDINDGRILVDGHDIKDFTRKDLGICLVWFYRILGYLVVAIMENIRYGRLMQQMRK